MTNNRFSLSAVPLPHLILDAEVLISYARLDNQTVGTALVDAVADTSCNIIVSSLSYLRAASRIYGTRAYGRLLRLMDRRPEGDEFPFIDVYELERDTATVLAALDIEDRPDIAHTALLALSYRCVVATLEPSAYHRLGYLRTVDLS
ncbi:hypothetical protein [Actinoplanes italicus]|uniref:hypothetical protein n=1 Tax=Actinoplanes italicus TaxID=113567 RepID=UPI000D059B92|nr:hypothetical protein [Actinoplanes italicus]